jgi:exodeoxyribonuclease V gamma subunit
MATTIYYSNKLEELVRILGENIKSSPCGIFISEHVITQTSGMKQWLAVEMAKKENNGVFANFKLENQDAFINSLYQLLTGQTVTHNLETSKWLLFSFLGSDEFRQNPDFKKVTEYYKENELKQIQLAARLNDLFDQYQVYRENIIGTWEAGQRAYPDSDAEPWQKELWEKLAGCGQVHSKYRMKREILNLLKNDENIEKVRKEFPILSFFGNSIYTNFHLEIFNRLAEVIPVNNYVLLPVKDPKTAFSNELLTNLGANADELKIMLGAENNILSLPKAPPIHNLLGIIQKQIFDNQNLSTAEILADELLQDGSIQINSAYTEAREVEILYNYLVNLIHRDPELKPTDIMVLATDIDRYAPFIQAVFSNAPFLIPFKISGVSNGRKDSILTALIKILDFREDDFTSEKVIGLLETRSISAKFGVTGTKHLRVLVEKANIRFGWEGRSQDDTRYVGWEYGLRKLAYGFAMLTEESIEIPGKEYSLYPFEDIEGKSGMDIFRVKAFAERLWNLVRTIDEKRTLAEWEFFIQNEVFEKMILPEDTDKEDLSLFYRQFRHLEEVKQLLPELRIHFTTFYSAFRAALLEESGEMGFNSGRVTFSSHIPARGLPAKVIAFLGLNNGKFPRKDRFVSYDLIAKERLTGDRSKKANDKQLFLDTLLSAREKLYLSYIGRNAKENSELPPSIVLDELMDYIESQSANPSLVREGILVHHPLHGFSGRYRPENNRLFTYLYGEDVQVENILLETQVADDPNDQPASTEIKLNDLINFYKSPVKWYYQRTIGIYLEEKEENLPEEETSELDHLESWTLKKELMNADSGIHEEKDKIREQYVKSGRFPLATFSEILIDSLLEDIAQVKTGKDQQTAGLTEETLGNILTINDKIKITGTVGGIYGNNLIEYSLSKQALKYKVETRIKYLFLTASGFELEARFIDRSGGLITFKPISTTEAVNVLAILAKYFLKGRQGMLRITLNAAENYLKNDNLEVIMSELIKEANGNPNSNTFPDLYLKRAISDGQFEDQAILGEHLEALASYLINF